jgi:4-amino-4-deoxy-L-arabinose transferase-like glycosyltransferase
MQRSLDTDQHVLAQRTSLLNLYDIGSIVLLALMGVLLVIQLQTTPALFWDEGWTVTVARTWVEQGYYGIPQEGIPSPPILSAAFPTVASVALSFKIFGVGIWQARLPGALLMLLAFVLLTYLARTLYGRRVAFVALAFLLLCVPQPDLHPIMLGRQVFAEPMMLALLLAGYIGLLWSLRTQPLVFMPITVLLWGLALISKVQPFPFWIVSLVVPLISLLWHRHWRASLIVGASLAGALLAMRGWRWLIALALQDRIITDTSARSEGLLSVTALVPVLDIRLKALLVLLLVGLPLAFGLLYGLGKWWHQSRQLSPTVDTARQVVQLALLVLAGSWLAWFVLLSVGWLRYLLPPLFVGSIFIGVALVDLACYVGRKVRHDVGSGQRKRWWLGWQGAGILLVVLLMSWHLAFGIKQPFGLLNARTEPMEAVQVANYLHQHTAPDALIESYDSEILFLVQRRHHFPPSQLHVELNRRTFLNKNVPIDYDPLAADPDYLVVGQYGRLWDLYDPAIESGAFRLLQEYSTYRIYERVRAPAYTR